MTVNVKKAYLFRTSLALFISALVAVLLIIFFEKCTLTFSLEISFLVFIALEVLLIYKDRLSPLLFLFISFGIGILDVILVGLGVRVVSNEYPIEIYEKSIGMIIIWIVSFIVGYYFTRKSKNRKEEARTSHLGNINIDIILFFFSILYLFAVIKVVETVIALGGVDSSMVNAAIFRYDDQAYLATILSLSSIIPICLMEKGKNKLAIVTTILMLIILVITGRRGMIINYLLIPILTYVNYKKIRITNKIGAIALIASMVVILVIGNMRGQNSISNSSNGVVGALTNLTVSTKLGETLPDTIYAIDNGDVEYGKFKYFYRGFIGLIPRAIWKDKPELIDHSTIISSNIYNVKTYGTPVGAFGYSYYCFGMIGVILVGLISGILTKKFYYWMLKEKDFIHVFLYSVLVINVINIIKPECQLTIISTFILVYMVIFISRLLSGRQNKKVEIA